MPSYALPSSFYFSPSLSTYLSPNIPGTRTPPSVTILTVSPSDLNFSARDPIDLDLLCDA